MLPQHLTPLEHRKLHGLSVERQRTPAFGQAVGKEVS